MTFLLTSTDLKYFMDTQGISGEMLILNVPTPTVETAAQAVGAHPDQIVKSVLFLIDGKPVLAIAYGIRHIEPHRLAEWYGVGRKRVKLANPETVVRLTGYSVGAVPPFGHPVALPTVLDPGVLKYEQVYAGGGSNNTLIRIDPNEIIRVSGAELIYLLKNGTETAISETK